LFLTALTREAGGRLPEDFAVALPKATSPEQVAALASLLDRFELALGFPEGSLRLELMVETPQAVLSLLPLAEAGRGRCAAAHLGTYDLTAALGITATYQTPRHLSVLFARHRMQFSLAGTGIRLAEGATTILPVGDRETVHSAWKVHYENIWWALVLGFYQG
jgi:citrate lyase beta subunit